MSYVDVTLEKIIKEVCDRVMWKGIDEKEALRNCGSRELLLELLRLLQADRSQMREA